MIHVNVHANNAVRIMLCMFISSVATAQTVIPKFDDICAADNVVDKERLARFLLDSKSVSRSLEDWAEANPDAQYRVSARVRMILDPDICTDGKAGAQCQAKDADKLRDTLQVIILMLRGYGGSFRNEGGHTSPYVYMTDPMAKLMCVRENGDPMGSVAPAKFNYTFPIRVRGSTDGLNFDREEPSFSVVQGASVTISDDNVSNKRVQKWAVVAGLALPQIVNDDERGIWAWVVPYIGSSRDITRVTGKTDTIATDAIYGGLLTDIRVLRERMTHYMTFTPEYRSSESDADTSELWTVTGTWMPIVGRLNAFRPLIVGKQFASGRFILDLRAAHGWFADRGNLMAPYNKDATRAGAQFGYAIGSDNPRWPVDVVVTETFLANLGNGKNLGYFSGRMSLGLDPKKIFTIDLSYSKGRRADVVAKEDLWKLTLGAKY